MPEFASVQVTPPSEHLEAWRCRLAGESPVAPEELAPEPGRSVLVVVAHPDDEVLAMGGTVSALAARGIAVDVVSLTSGEAALHHVGHDLEELATRRRLELKRACARLGARTVRCCDWPDGRLRRHVRQATRDVAAVVGRCGTGRVLTLWRDDPHPDHGAAAAIASMAARSHSIPVTEFLLWAVHWTDPADVHHVVRPLDVDDAGRRAKRSALAAYRSQTRPLVENLEPVLPRSVVTWQLECMTVDR